MDLINDANSPEFSAPALGNWKLAGAGPTAGTALGCAEPPGQITGAPSSASRLVADGPGARAAGSCYVNPSKIRSRPPLVVVTALQGPSPHVPAAVGFLQVRAACHTPGFRMRPCSPRPPPFVPGWRHPPILGVVKMRVRPRHANQDKDLLIA